MVFPRKLPPNPVLLKIWADPDITEAEIARRYGTTRSAVHQALTRATHADRGPRTVYRDEIPWKLRAEDMQEYAVKMLRAYGAKRLGRELSPDRQGMLEKFMRSLDERNEVVAYDPQRPQGQRFYLVPRRKGDIGYTRKPD